MTTMKRTSFSDLRKQKSNFEALQKKIQGATEKKSYSDNRFWKAAVDKAGNGSAVIRFLPETSEDGLPWIKMFKHGFQGPTGQWFIENCPTTRGGECPVCAANGELWNSGIESDKDIVRKRKRKLSYISNILVVNDPANPENNGKVFLFEYGQKIWEKLNAAMNPEFDDEEAFYPFHLWDGANFKLKITKKDGYTSYDKSSFDVRKPVADSDEEIEAIYNQQFDLSEFTSEDKFKSFEDLDARFRKVIAEDTPSRARSFDENVAEEEYSAKVEKVDADDVPFDIDDENLLSEVEALLDD